MTEPRARRRLGPLRAATPTDSPFMSGRWRCTAVSRGEPISGSPRQRHPRVGHRKRTGAIFRTVPPQPRAQHPKAARQVLARRADGMIKA